MYTIIGQIVKENFYDGSESTVGYYVVDTNGNHKFGSVPEVYQLYRQSKISEIIRIAGFNTESGEFNFFGANKSLFPKYSISLFNNSSMGTIYSVSREKGVCRLRDTKGNIQQLSEQEVIKGVKNGTIRLNNATVSGNSLTINDAIIILRAYVENGVQTRFSIVLPNGEITVLSRLEVENLIKQQNFKLFNATISDGIIVPCNSLFPVSIITPDGIDERVHNMDYTDTFYILVNRNVEQVTLRGIYSGTVRNGKPHGKGTFKYIMFPNDSHVMSNGDYVMTEGDYVTYEGDYVDGIKQGKGAVNWSYCITERGKIKERHHYFYGGDIKDNRFDGKGVLSRSNEMYARSVYMLEGIFEKGRAVDLQPLKPCEI